MASDFERAQLTRSLQAVAAGDRAALADVYQRTSAKLFGVILRILHDNGEAEDVLQEVYLTVWRKAGSFEPGRASPITWLASLARNRAIDRLRSLAVRPTAPLEAAGDPADASPSAVAALEADEEHARLMACLDELEENARASIRTAFFEGRTYQELAEAARVPLGTMKGWIRRGLMKLRACLT